MKIKTIHTTYERVMALPRPKKKKPKRPNLFFRSLVRVLSSIGMAGVEFSAHKEIERAGKGPYLILMNHSCFLDVQIVSRLFYPMPYGVVTTTDGFVGKSWLMRQIGCIPTKKFISDMGLIRDMDYMLKKEKTSVLLFPEAGYSLDGRATVLPRKMGGLLKLLKVPVLFVFAEGAFLRTPLYGGLKNRKVPVHAEARCLLTREEIAQKPAEELDAILDEAFGFDSFKLQREKGIEVRESDRAEGLERVLYKCPHCLSEGQLRGKGDTLTCHACGKSWRMSVLGELEACEGETVYSHIPDWFDWQRACVREELEAGTYRLDTEVDIGMIVDSRALYMVGSGRLVHDCNGFVLTGCDGALEYVQKPRFSYSLNADYYWYEIGDMISIGNHDQLFYCFPKTDGVVAKTRLATEELFKRSLPERS
ncbi:MAG: 1-acyl-sn-glycerol-3-phosphate acyltransferase [Clostridia bacterium]|nr:1-acyl-sn-glycerol-3-phosphate acyltransferase [Clostridia bacterium]MBQ9774291.1 1-acyl-sn-glycerol-3-phosphate acyltransferase [Clostridia bacterium]